MGFTKSDYDKDQTKINYNFITQADRDRINSFVIKSIETGTVQEVTYSYMRKDGSKGYLSRRMRAIPQPEENTYILFSVAHDITHKVDREKRLSKEQEAFNNLEKKVLTKQNNLISAFKFNLTQNKIISAIRVGQKFSSSDNKYTIDEFIKKYKPQILSNEKQFDEAFSYNNLMEKKSENEEIICEYQRYVDTDEAIWCRTKVAFSNFAYNNDEVALVYSYDITKEKTISLAMEKVAETNFDFVFIINTQKEMIYQAIVNPELKGYETQVEKLLKNEPVEYAPYYNEFFNRFCKIAPYDSIKATSIETIKEKLEIMPVYTYAVTLYNEQTNADQRVIFKYTYLDESKLSIVSTRSDVTAIYNKELARKEELSRALKKANEANNAKTAFLSTVSHDMRTPLNGILGLAQLILDKDLEESLREDLEQIKNSGEYLLSLINDTLDVSKIESGNMTLNPNVCVATDILDSVIKLTAPNLQAKNMELNLVTEPLPHTMVYVDIGRIEQIFMNIIGNAIKFSPNGEKITLEVEHIVLKNDVLLNRITIADNGIGMSKEFLKHIFEPFSQENKTNSTKYKGTGLGMCIAKQIIELMGGEITINSELNIGTAVSFTLPMPIATKEQIIQSKKFESITISKVDFNNKRVLICEDQPLNVSIVTRLLQKVGMIVETVENGLIGYEKFIASTEGYYDVILMDIRMPVMDGLEATEKIRNSNHIDAKMIPIIATTANAFESYAKESRKAGMTAHISKPIMPQTLYNTISDEIAKAISRKNIAILNQKNRPKILVVDDMEINLVVIKEALLNNYDVLVADNGEDALKILRQTSDIIAVITDIQMPNMNGLELIKKIRDNENYNYVALIANTQYGDAEQEEALILAGADDFVYKPTKPAVIIARLENVLCKYGK